MVVVKGTQSRPNSGKQIPLSRIDGCLRPTARFRSVSGKRCLSNPRFLRDLHIQVKDDYRPGYDMWQRAPARLEVRFSKFAYTQSFRAAGCVGPSPIAACAEYASIFSV